MGENQGMQQKVIRVLVGILIGVKLIARLVGRRRADWRTDVEKPDREPGDQVPTAGDFDGVAEASEESFPASDAPAFSPLMIH